MTMSRRAALAALAAAPAALLLHSSARQSVVNAGPKRPNPSEVADRVVLAGSASQAGTRWNLIAAMILAGAPRDEIVAEMGLAINETITAVDALDDL